MRQIYTVIGLSLHPAGQALFFVAMNGFTVKRLCITPKTGLETTRFTIVSL